MMGTNKEAYIQITKDLYKLTLLFPKKEPLRYKLREAALEILIKPDDRDFEVLDNFLDVAKNQNWVRLADILAIQANYANLRRALPEVFPEINDKEISQPAFLGKFEKSEKNERQEKIIDFLRENEKAQVWEVKKVFPRISKRTLRRDIDFLLRQGVIQRIGEKNNTFYQIKSI